MHQQDAPMTNMLGASVYVPPPSHQMPTIDPYIPPPSRQMHTINRPRSVFNPEPIEYPDHGAVDYPDLSFVMNEEMSWVGSGSGEAMLPPLGSFVHPIPTLTLPPPCMIDPALTLPDRADPAASVGKEDKWTAELHTIFETESDHRLHNTHTNLIQSRNPPHQQRSPVPPFNSPEPKIPPNSAPPTRRPRLVSRARSKSFTPQPETQGPCLTCGKNYRTSTSPGRCSRCGIKWERHTAGPPTYVLDPAVPDCEAAQAILYPDSRGRRDNDDDVMSVMNEAGVQDLWMLKWLDALNSPVVVTETEGKASWSSNQQTTFNQKAKMDREGDFSTAFVTARLRALWQEVVAFHCGGRSFYPVGGDSAGYTEDLGLKFGERLEAIREVMEVDKRTVMDVVEGRGVGAFVGNPWVNLALLLMKIGGGVLTEFRDSTRGKTQIMDVMSRRKMC